MRATFDTLSPMRAVLQRVLEASVTVEGRIVGAIAEPGLVVLLGTTHDDDQDDVDWMVRKVRDLRIMRKERSLADLGAPALVISQFTLYGDARKGRRPTWQAASPPGHAMPLVQRVCDGLRAAGTRTEEGVFGADMQVHLVNDGPMTLVLSSR